MAQNMPSPAISIVGRHNSGKTTLIEQLIAQLTADGLDVGSIKHHSHKGFEIDIPGKDSYRHRAAGSTETVVAAPGQIARMRTIQGEVECVDIVKQMPGHDIVIVEGYRKSGLPTIEVMRSGNPADQKVAQAFYDNARAGEPLSVDDVQVSRKDVPGTGGHIPEKTVVPQPGDPDISEKMPTGATVGVVTDIPLAREAASLYGIPAFDIDDIAGITDFLEREYSRKRVTVVIQAGGESRRMGRSKATVPFAGHPLITRIVGRLLPAADELVITTNEPQNLGFLKDYFPDQQIRLVTDECDYRGALPGLYTALKAASFPYAAVVACDMVFASSNLIAAECLEMHRTGADAVVPVNKHGYEPFHAMYNRDACLPAIERALAAGDKRAQAIYGAVNVQEFPQSKVLEVEPMGGCFVNTNTPEELHDIEENFLED